VQINRKELEDRVALGLIRAVPHPTLPLTLWHYTEHNIYEARSWDYYTMAARGLVTTGVGPMLDIVAKHYTKFFNVGEFPDTLPDHLPSLPYECTEKVDGSMIEAYAFQDQIMIHTKGAWDNEQGQRAREHMHAHFSRTVLRDLCIQTNFTLLFEITYPGNAAVQYGPDTNMQLTGAVSRVTGQDLFYVDLHGLSVLLDCPLVQRYKYMGLTDVFEYNTPGIEGFVVRFANGLRVKVKTDWFKSVFRVRYYWSEGRILKMLVLGEPVDVTAADLPAEERVAVSELLEQLHVSYNGIEAEAQRVVADLAGLTRKDQALRLLAEHVNLAPVCFALLAGKRPAKVIWQMVQRQRGIAESVACAEP
jgi:RNA ligase